MQINNKHISEGDVEYDLCPGDIQLQTDRGLIDMSWGWVPVLDFAIYFKRICNALSHIEDGCEKFGFTENDEYLKLCREKNMVKIHPSFDGDTLTINFEEFSKEVDRFYNSVLEDVFNANPFLKSSKEFLQIVNNVN